jgi:hypothetical protein
MQRNAKQTRQKKLHGKKKTFSHKKVVSHVVEIALYRTSRNAIKKQERGKNELSKSLLLGL